VQLGFAPSYEKYLARMLEVLAAAGYLQWNGKSVRVLRSAVDGDSGALDEVLRNAMPLTSIESDLLARCVAGAPAVLQGKVDPVELLFARDQKITLDTFYTQSPAYQALNELIRSVISNTLKQLGDDRRLRVLEVGAGTGATTLAILPLLPADRTEYVFTDISPAFLAAAPERFATLGNFHTRIFDVGQPGPPQSISCGQYDLVFAINVLHATEDLRRSTRHLVELIAPGGLLVI